MSAWETPERRALREMVTSFTEKEVVPHLPAWEDACEVPRELHQKAADAGLLGVAFPEEVGGQGGDLIDSAIVSEAVLEAGGSTGLIAALFTHGIALPHIVASGNADLIDRYVRPTLAGELIGSLGITEPGGGSDVANIRTKAVRDPSTGSGRAAIRRQRRQDLHHLGRARRLRDDGRAYRRRGLRRHQPAGHRQGHARIHRRPAAQEDGLALLRHRRAELRRRTRAGRQHRGRGRRRVRARRCSSSSASASSLAVQAYSTAQRSLDLAVAYARERETFGKPLISRQVIRHKLVDMHRRTAAARALTRQAVERAVAGDPTDPAVILDAVLAKNQSVEACEWVVSEAVQIFGGMGYMRESEIDRHYRDARILGIGGGATEVLNDLAAKLLGY